MLVLLLRAPSPHFAVGTALLRAQCGDSGARLTSQLRDGAWAPGWSHRVYPGASGTRTGVHPQPALCSVRRERRERGSVFVLRLLRFRTVTQRSRNLGARRPRPRTKPPKAKAHLQRTCAAGRPVLGSATPGAVLGAHSRNEPQKRCYLASSRAHASTYLGTCERTAAGDRGPEPGACFSESPRGWW